MLYHSDSMGDVKKLLAIEDKFCRDYADSKQMKLISGDQPLTQTDAHHSTEQNQLMEQFTMIGRQVNVVLEHMRARLDGQAEFIELVYETVEIAQQLLDQAIADKKVKEEKLRLEREERELQMRELSLMALEEKFMRDLMAAEKR